MPSRLDLLAKLATSHEEYPGGGLVYTEEDVPPVK